MLKKADNLLMLVPVTLYTVSTFIAAMFYGG